MVVVHRLAIVVYGSRGWHHSTLPNSAVGLHKRSALQLHMAPKQILETQHGVGQQPPWRRPLGKSDQPFVRLDARTPSLLDGNSLSTLGASQYLVTASMQGQGARRRRGEVVTSRQSAKEYEAEAATGDKTIYHQPARDDAHQCKDELRRTRHTPVIHYGPRRLVVRWLLVTWPKHLCGAVGILICEDCLYGLRVAAHGKKQVRSVPVPARTNQCYEFAVGGDTHSRTPLHFQHLHPQQYPLSARPVRQQV